MISLKKVKMGILMLSLVTVLSACTSNDEPNKKCQKVVTPQCLFQDQHL